MNNYSCKNKKLIPKSLSDSKLFLILNFLKEYWVVHMKIKLCIEYRILFLYNFVSKVFKVFRFIVEVS